MTSVACNLYSTVTPRFWIWFCESVSCTCRSASSLANLYPPRFNSIFPISNTSLNNYFLPSTHLDHLNFLITFHSSQFRLVNSPSAARQWMDNFKQCHFKSTFSLSGPSNTYHKPFFHIPHFPHTITPYHQFNSFKTIYKYCTYFRILIYINTTFIFPLFWSTSNT